MSDWEEVRKLAADFQKLQASTGTHKLSERNCIEVVGRLVAMGMLEVVYTLDGKEYVTPQHLEREIRNELLLSRGRINVVELQQLLNVDLYHVEAKVNEILKHDRSLVLLQGELIDRSYVRAMCEEINDTLQEVGQMLVADISKNFGLPNDFLMEHIESSLGTIINGQLDKTDSGVIYTESYVSRYHSRIRGLFSAITCPTPVGPIIAQGAFQEKLFQTVLQELISTGQLAGSLHGRMDKAVYIPNIYTQMQNTWTDSFLASSGYLEYDALRRLGIENPRDYISQRYANRSDVIQLVTCAIGEAVTAEVEGGIEEAVASGGWTDIMPLLPSPCTTEDAALLLQQNFRSLKHFDTIVVTKEFLQSCFDHFEPLVKEKAQKAAVTHSKLISELSTRSDNDGGAQKGGGTKKGGGSKRRGKGKSSQPSEERERGTEFRELQFMSIPEIVGVLHEKYPDCPEELMIEVAREIQSPLQRVFNEQAKSHLTSLDLGQSVNQQRKRHANMQEKVLGLWNNATLFRRAISHFDDDTSFQVSKYLLRTLGSDLVNMVVVYLAEDYGVATPTAENMTTNERTKIISAVPAHMKKMLTAVTTALNGKDVSKFLDIFDDLCKQDYCGIMLKKLDKKKERQMLFSHQQSLLANLREEQDPAMALHLVTVILFQQHTGCIIHMPGKLVPHVITFLESQMKQEEHSKLVRYQKLVTLQWKSANTKSSSSNVVNKNEIESPSVENSTQTVVKHSNEEQVESKPQPSESQLGDSVSSQQMSEPTSGESPSQEPTDTGGESPSQEPTDTGGESPFQEPTDTGGESPSQEPTDTGGESPSQEPTDTGGESPSQEPTDTGGESQSQEPTDTGGESTSQEPTDTGGESPSQEPTDTGGERKPAGEPDVDTEQQLRDTLPELKKLVVRQKKPSNEL